MTQVAIFIGSSSDQEKIMPCIELLKEFGIKFLAKVCSAHRTPMLVDKLVRKSESEGVKVFICAAGLAAHLAGAVASRTMCPVIGIPVSTGPALAGLDALFSTVQMPAGFPVATLAMDKTGAKNAAWLAAQILALNDEKLRNTLVQKRKEMAELIENTEINL